MSYELLDLGNGRQALRVTFDRTTHIVQNDDATWAVVEDEANRAFASYCAALDCARELAGDPDVPLIDPDLPPLTQS
jgi:hypothetical protein